jgi:cysteinyl-tRNA synthetase
VLWKPSKPGEPAWPSPAGIGAPGRPGWHIECSAMSWKHLGETFDIHGGGIDLVFPHHENEIAQSRCAFHTPVMANVWMHNGFLQVEGEKMIKSLGNFVTIHELLHTEKFGKRSWSGDALRLAMLKTHYRQPIDWTVHALNESVTAIDGWRRILNRFPESVFEKAPDRFLKALADDLNAPRALAVMFEYARLANRIAGSADGVKLGESLPESEIEKGAARLRGCLEILGFSLAHEKPTAKALPQDAMRLIEARDAARKAKNFKESDRIRDELAAIGIVVKDTKDGTTWEIAR